MLYREETPIPHGKVVFDEYLPYAQDVKRQRCARGTEKVKVLQRGNEGESTRGRKKETVRAQGTRERREVKGKKMARERREEAPNRAHPASHQSSNPQRRRAPGHTLWGGGRGLDRSRWTSRIRARQDTKG